MAAWLRENAPGAAAMDRVGLRALVERQEPRAARFGLRTRREQAKWCVLAVLTAERFDEVPGVAAYLADPFAGPPGERLDALLRATAEAMDAQAFWAPPPGHVP